MKLFPTTTYYSNQSDKERIINNNKREITFPKLFNQIFWTRKQSKVSLTKVNKKKTKSSR